MSDLKFKSYMDFFQEVNFFCEMTESRTALCDLTKKSNDFNFSLYFVFQELKMMHGKDMLKTPCFKETMMYSIGSTTLVTVAYNFTTSKNPSFLIKYVYPVTFFGSW